MGRNGLQKIDAELDQAIKMSEARVAKLLRQHFTKAQLKNDMTGIVATVAYKDFMLRSKYKQQIVHSVQEELPKQKRALLDDIVDDATVDFKEKIQARCQDTVLQLVEEELKKMKDLVHAEYVAETVEHLGSQMRAYGMYGLAMGGVLNFASATPVAEAAGLSAGVAAAGTAACAVGGVLVVGGAAVTAVNAVWSDSDGSIKKGLIEEMADGMMKSEFEGRATHLVHKRLTALKRHVIHGCELLEDEAPRDGKYVKARSFQPYQSILWHDPNIMNSENQRYLATLKKRFDECHACSTPEEADAHLAGNPLTSFIVLTSGSNGEQLLALIHKKSNVGSVEVFCRNPEYHKAWCSKYKTKLPLEPRIHTNVSQVVTALSEVRQRDVLGFVTMEEASAKMEESHRIFLHSMVQKEADELTLSECIHYLLTVRNAKNPEFHSWSFLGFGGGPQAVDEVDKTSLHNVLVSSDPSKVAELWTDEKSKFCYTLTAILREKKTDQGMLMMARLGEDMVSAFTKLGNNHPQYVFRGQCFRGLRIDDDALFDQYRQSRNHFVWFREFMATSELPSVATNFLNMKPCKYKVTLVIDAASYSEHVISPLKIAQWSKFPGEKEVLFPLLSGFLVTDVQESSNSLVLHLRYEWSPLDPCAAFIYAFI